MTKGDVVSAGVPYFASVDSGLLYVGLRSGGTGRTVTFNLVSAGITPNAWHHLAASFDGGTRILTVYIDGVQRAQGALTSGSTTNNLPLIVGRSGTVGDYWLGKVDDLWVWNVVRTGTQIVANYQTEIGPTAGLVGDWHFNEGSGTTAADSTTPAESFTLLGGAGWSNDVHP